MGLGLVGLGWLNLRKSKSAAWSGVKLGLVGGKLNLQRFLDKMDLSLGLLVKVGVGLLGKRVNSLKSLYVILHLFVRILNSYTGPAFKKFDAQWARPALKKYFLLFFQHGIFITMFHVRNSFQNMLVISPASKMPYEPLAVLFTNGG